MRVERALRASVTRTKSSKKRRTPLTWQHGDGFRICGGRRAFSYDTMDCMALVRYSVMQYIVRRFTVNVNNFWILAMPFCGLREKNTKIYWLYWVLRWRHELVPLYVSFHHPLLRRTHKYECTVPASCVCSATGETGTVGGCRCFRSHLNEHSNAPPPFAHQQPLTLKP